MWYVQVAPAGWGQTMCTTDGVTTTPRFSQRLGVHDTVTGPALVRNAVDTKAAFRIFAGAAWVAAVCPAADCPACASRVLLARVQAAIVAVKHKPLHHIRKRTLIWILLASHSDAPYNLQLFWMPL